MKALLHDILYLHHHVLFVFSTSQNFVKQKYVGTSIYRKKFFGSRVLVCECELIFKTLLKLLQSVDIVKRDLYIKMDVCFFLYLTVFCLSGSEWKQETSNLVVFEILPSRPLQQSAQKNSIYDSRFGGPVFEIT